MRGAGRPASFAAERMVGTVWVSTVLGPVIQVAVPSARRPATSSICVPSAATMIGGAALAGTVTAAEVLTVSPWKSTARSRSSGPSTERYSRMWRTGLSKDRPQMPSTTSLWDRPMPSRRRLPVAACTVSACWASIIGCRG